MRSLDTPGNGARPSGATTSSSPDIGAVAVARQAPLRGGDKLHVTFVRGPIVSTTTAFNNEATPCIAFAYLSAYIADHGYTYTLVDSIAEGLNQTWPLASRPGFQCRGLTYEEIVGRIPPNTDVIAVSAMFSGEWPVMRDLIRLAREQHPHALIVAGGEHITALTEFSLRDCPAIDVAVCGEGELIFYELLEAFRAGNDFSQVSGVAFLDAEHRFVQVDGLQRMRNIDTLPWPIWPDGYLEQFWQAGKSYGVQTARDMPIMASRGCPYQCSFCSSPAMWTTRYVLRDIEDLTAEIKSYIKRYDITALQFYDLTAITKKRWTIEFCNRLIAEGINIKWSLPSGTRSEALDAETLALLKKTNCNYLVYAPESGSPDTLKTIRKRVELPRLTESVLEAKRQGIVVRTNLIIGFPHETRRHVAQTIRYGLYLAWKGADEVSINIFSPYPGTEIFRELLVQKKIALNDDYFFSLTSLNSDYTSLNPITCNPTMGARELAVYRIGFMLANYLVGYLRYPSRILRTIANVFFKKHGTATVFEHRLKDLFHRHAA